MDDDIFRQFEAYERSFIDPPIQRTIDTVHIANGKLAHPLATLEEGKTLVNEIDEMWGNYIAGDFTVSGTVLSKVETTNSLGEIIVTYEPLIKDGLPATSQGFDVISLPTYVDGIYKGNQLRIVYLFMVPVQYIIEDHPVGPFRQIYCEIDSVIVQPDVMSHERAEILLKEAHPEIITVIDELAEITEDRETDLVMLLSKVNWIEYIDISSEDNREMLEVYLNHKVELDQEVPYDAIIDGPVRYYAGEYDGESEEFLFEDVEEHVDKRLVSSEYLFFGMVGDTAARQLLLHGEIVTKVKKVPAKTVDIPLTSFQSLESHRNKFYDS